MTCPVLSTEPVISRLLLTCSRCNILIRGADIDIMNYIFLNSSFSDDVAGVKVDNIPFDILPEQSIKSRNKIDHYPRLNQMVSSILIHALDAGALLIPIQVHVSHIYIVEYRIF